MHRFERSLTRLFARMLAGFQRSVPGENLMNLGFGATVGVIYASLFRGEAGQTVGGWFIAPVVLVFIAIFMISCVAKMGAGCLSLGDRVIPAVVFAVFAVPFVLTLISPSQYPVSDVLLRGAAISWFAAYYLLAALDLTRGWLDRELRRLGEK